MIAHVVIFVFAVLLLAAAWTDARGFTIPNWIPGALVALWPLGAVLLGLGWADAGFALATGLGLLVVMIALWSTGSIGGGDAKLLAAAGLWFGWPDVLIFLLFTAVAGGVLALALVMLRRLAPWLPIDAARLDGTVLAPGQPAPYAVAIAAGALIALPQSALLAG